MYFKSVKARDNFRVERLKERIQLELRRPLTDQEEYLLELSAAILGSDDDEPDLPPKKAA